MLATSEDKSAEIACDIERAPVRAVLSVVPQEARLALVACCNHELSALLSRAPSMDRGGNLDYVRLRE